MVQGGTSAASLLASTSPDQRQEREEGLQYSISQVVEKGHAMDFALLSFNLYSS